MFPVLANLFVFSLIIISTESGVSTHNPFYCYSQDPIKPQHQMFNIQTGYESARGRVINPNVSTCTPSKFWMIGRHGTRMPNVNSVTNMRENAERLHRQILSYYDQGRTSICASDIESLKSWTLDPNLTLENAQALTTAGWYEIENLAIRYQAAFPTLFPSTYSPSHYLFRGTGTHRTEMSLNAFADGLFGVGEHENVQFEDVPERDYLLSASTFCPLYNEIVAISPEQEAFREGVEYQEMTTQVSAKLGFHGSHALRNIEISVLSQTCRYEQIWYPNSTSPFCAFFSIANHQVLEYYTDLEIYFRLGYGNPDYRRLYENLPCFLMQDLLDFIRSNDTNDHKAKIFSQNLTMLMMIVINLGAFEDNVPLTRHNFAQQTQRLFKSSLISGMGVNLVVVRYDCADDDNDLLFLYNEKPLQIPGCESNGLCKQSLIVDRLSRFLNADCMELFCSNTL